MNSIYNMKKKSNLYFLVISLLFGFTQPIPSLQASAGDRDHHFELQEVRKKNEKDTAITRQIRKEIKDSNWLSNKAKKMRITTADGRVTLKGDVRSRSEENFIISSARTAAGPMNVVNRISVGIDVD